MNLSGIVVALGVVLGVYLLWKMMVPSFSWIHR